MQLPSLANLRGTQLDRARRVMLLLLVIFQALTVITILVFSRITNEAVLLTQAQQILNNATEESIRHTEEFLDSAFRDATTAAEMFANDVLSTAETSRIESYFVNQLKHNDEYAGMYFGAPSGNFLYVSRETDSAKGVYRTKLIDPEHGNAFTQLWWRDSADNKTRVTRDLEEEFDPRTRPWFRKAQQQNGFVWTDPYIFFTAQKFGVTAAVPVKSSSGTPAGVLGVDLELEQLARFLNKLNISDSGSAFITNRDGILIASPHNLPKGAVSDSRKAPELLTVDAITDPVLRAALEAVADPSRLSETGQAATFTVAGQQYLSDLMTLELADGGQWLVGTYAAERDFLDAIRNNERRNILLASGVLLLSMIIGWFLASTAWIPVEALHKQANRDPLTQVRNRRYLTRTAGQLFAEASRNAEAICLAIVDLDHFKSINDRYGHAAGDAVLQNFAGKLESACRAHDLVARFGGEEFVVLLPTANAATTTKVLRRVRQELKANPCRTDAGPIPVTFSAGICEANETLTTYEQTLQAADQALLLAKHKRDTILIAGQT